MCPLTSLFLLVMDCLSRKMNATREKGLIVGVRMDRKLFVSHHMFVDDLLIGGQSSIKEWEEIHKILASFGNVT